MARFGSPRTRSSLPANGFANAAASFDPLVSAPSAWNTVAINSLLGHLPSQGQQQGLSPSGGRVTKSLETEIDMPSPRFFFVDEGRRQHFLGACFLCKKPIAENEDVFMYRGDTPFCSTGCRWAQVDMDEALQNEARTQSRPPVKRKPSLIVRSECDENQFVADATAVVAG